MRTTKIFLTALCIYFSASSAYAQNKFPASGNVGIGTASPANLLHINLNGLANDKINGLRIQYQPNSVVMGEIGYDKINGGFSIHSWAGGPGYGWADIAFKTNGTTKMFIESAGRVGIGTTSPTSLLTVNGTITAEEVVVQDVGADYVFEEQYKLKSLMEVEEYIKKEKHLPGIAPASETEQGIKVGEFNEKLLEKIEELTLYMIDLNKQMEELKQENQLLREAVELKK